MLRIVGSDKEKPEAAKSNSSEAAEKAKKEAGKVVDDLKEVVPNGEELEDKFGQFTESIGETLSELWEGFIKMLNKFLKGLGIEGMFDQKDKKDGKESKEKASNKALKNPDETVAVGASNTDMMVRHGFFRGDFAKGGYDLTAISRLCGLGNPDVRRIGTDAQKENEEALKADLKNKGIKHVVMQMGSNDLRLQEKEFDWVTDQYPAEFTNEQLERIEKSDYWRWIEYMHGVFADAVGPENVYMCEFVPFLKMKFWGENVSPESEVGKSRINRKRNIHLACNLLMNRRPKFRNVIKIGDSEAQNHLHPTFASQKAQYEKFGFRSRKEYETEKAMDRGVEKAKENKEIAAETEHPRPEQVACLGDSLANGAAARTNGYQNYGIASESSFKIRQRAETAIDKALKNGANNLVIFAGANDGRMRNTVENIRAMVNMAKEKGFRRIYVATIPIYDEDPGYKQNFTKIPDLRERLEKFNAEIGKNFPDAHKFEYPDDRKKLHQPVDKVRAAIDDQLNVNRDS